MGQVYSSLILTNSLEPNGMFLSCLCFFAHRTSFCWYGSDRAGAAQKCIMCSNVSAFTEMALIQWAWYDEFSMHSTLATLTWAALQVDFKHIKWYNVMVSIGNHIVECSAFEVCGYSNEVDGAIKERDTSKKNTFAQVWFTIVCTRKKTGIFLLLWTDKKHTATQKSYSYGRYVFPVFFHTLSYRQYWHGTA